MAREWYNEVREAYPEWKQRRLPLWIRFLLWFKRAYVAFDCGYDNAPVLFYKWLFGRCYIVGEDYLQSTTTAEGEE